VQQSRAKVRVPSPCRTRLPPLLVTILGHTWDTECRNILVIPYGILPKDTRGFPTDAFV
jgi:hypothetical protein